MISSSYPIKKDYVSSQIFPYRNRKLRAVAIIGDSNADGSGKLLQPCPSDTLYSWDGTSTTEITRQSIKIEIPDGWYNSIAQSFAIAYKSYTGDPVLWINCGRGQSRVSAGGGVHDWSTTGDLYVPFKQKVAAGLAENSIDQLEAIIVNVALNDWRGGASSATVKTAYDSLISRLTTDFPNVPILLINMGRSLTTTTDQIGYEIREMIVNQAKLNTNVHMIASAYTGAPNGNLYMEADLVHYANPLQDYLGKAAAKWLYYSQYSKWGRSAIASLFDDPLSYRKVLIDNFMSSQVTSGNLFLWDALHIFKTSDIRNLFIDFSFLGAGFPRTSTFLANDSISTDGVATFFDTNYTENFYTKRTSQDDMFVGVKVKNRTSTGAGSLFGAANSGSTVVFNLLQQTSPSPILFRANDVTNSAGTDILVQSPAFYGVGRNGTTKDLWKNGSIQATATQASTGQTATGAQNFLFSIGAINSAGTRSGFVAGQYEYAVITKYTTFDVNNFYTNIETLVNNW